MKYSTLLITGVLSTMTISCSNTHETDGAEKGTETEKMESSEQETKTDTSEPTKEKQTNTDKKTYKVATVLNYPPFAASDEERNRIGFDIEIIDAIAEKQHFNVTYISTDTEWETWKEDLNNGKYDIWASGISITDERKEIVDFSDPYLDSNTAIMIIDNEQTKDIDINNINELTMSAEADTVDFELATRLSKSNGPAAVATETSSLGIEQLVRGKVGAFVANDVVLRYYKNLYPDIKTRIIYLDKDNNIEQVNDYLGFPVKKDNTELTTSLNEGLSKIRVDGTYDKISKKWFGSNTRNLVR